MIYLQIASMTYIQNTPFADFMFLDTLEFLKKKMFNQSFFWQICVKKIHES